LGTASTGDAGDVCLGRVSKRISRKANRDVKVTELSEPIAEVRTRGEGKVARATGPEPQKNEAKLAEDWKEATQIPNNQDSQVVPSSGKGSGVVVHAANPKSDLQPIVPKRQPDMEEIFGSEVVVTRTPPEDDAYELVTSSEERACEGLPDELYFGSFEQHNTLQFSAIQTRGTVDCGAC